MGGRLAIEHALDHPPGLRAIVVADSPASIQLWVAEANRLREEAGTRDSPEYEAAVRI